MKKGIISKRFFNKRKGIAYVNRMSAVTGAKWYLFKRRFGYIALARTRW